MSQAPRVRDPTILERIGAVDHVWSQMVQPVLSAGDAWPALVRKVLIMQLLLPSIFLVGAILFAVKASDAVSINAAASRAAITNTNSSGGNSNSSSCVAAAEEPVAGFAILSAALFLFTLCMCIPSYVYARCTRTAPEWLITYVLTVFLVVSVMFDIACAFFPIRSALIGIAILGVGCRLQLGKLFSALCAVYMLLVELRDAKTGLEMRIANPYDATAKWYERLLVSLVGVAILVSSAVLVNNVSAEMETMQDAADDAADVAEEARRVIVNDLSQPRVNATTATTTTSRRERAMRVDGVRLLLLNVEQHLAGVAQEPSPSDRRDASNCNCCCCADADAPAAANSSSNKDEQDAVRRKQPTESALRVVRALRTIVDTVSATSCALSGTDARAAADGGGETSKDRLLRPALRYSPPQIDVDASAAATAAVPVAERRPRHDPQQALLTTRGVQVARIVLCRIDFAAFFERLFHTLRLTAQLSAAASASAAAPAAVAALAGDISVSSRVATLLRRVHQIAAAFDGRCVVLSFTDDVLEVAFGAAPRQAMTVKKLAPESDGEEQQAAERRKRRQIEDDCEDFVFEVEQMALGLLAAARRALAVVNSAKPAAADTSTSTPPPPSRPLSAKPRRETAPPAGPQPSPGVEAMFHRPRSATQRPTAAAATDPSGTSPSATAGADYDGVTPREPLSGGGGGDEGVSEQAEINDDEGSDDAVDDANNKEERDGDGFDSLFLIVGAAASGTAWVQFSGESDNASSKAVSPEVPRLLSVLQFSAARELRERMRELLSLREQHASGYGVDSHTVHSFAFEWHRFQLPSFSAPWFRVIDPPFLGAERDSADAAATAADSNAAASDSDPGKKAIGAAIGNNSGSNDIAERVYCSKPSGLFFLPDTGAHYDPARQQYFLEYTWLSKDEYAARTAAREGQ